jgi:Asp-tRNA(Asn)/Glu-tRNA(Gln) amidotransferase A subunit family amidase
MLADSVLYLPVRELGERIRRREVSPIELTQSYLRRSEEIGPRFNAYVTITRELALEQAGVAEKEIASGHYRGPLHGIPYAAKDLVAVNGYPTTWGARPFKQQRLSYNATIIERLNDAGAILIGKAAMIELAGGLGYSSGFASLTGPSRNPWNTKYWTCGSSSGSGAIVAAALAPWALGSDTRGSILCPAAHCGICGLRPSFGRVSCHGAMTIAWTMDKLGPMCRTADDCGLVLSVLAGHDSRDHDSLPHGLAEFAYSRPSDRQLRVGKVTNAWPKLPADLEIAVDDALAVMEKQGATISDAEFPEGPYEEAAELTILIEAAASFQQLIHSGRCAELDDPLGQINGYASLEFSANDYLQVQRVRKVLQERMDKLFDEFDVLVTASQSGTAEQLRESRQATKRPNPKTRRARHPNESRAPDGVSSLCGLPALTVPCGFSQEKLPYGLGFMGRALQEENILAAANLFQTHTDWHRRYPPIEA